MHKQNCVSLSRTLRHHARLLYSTQASRITETFLKPLDAETCISLIKQCKTVQSLKSVHASMLRSHLHLNLFLSTNLIANYASLGSISHAYALFSVFSSSSSDVFLWNVMIRGFVDLGFYDRAIFTYKQMLELGISPDNYTFPFVIKACGCVCDFELGVKLHQHVVEHGYDTDVFVGNSLVAMYGKCGRFKVARQVFEKIPEKNVVSWSSMIGAYAQNRCFEEGLSLFARMLDEGIRPHRVSVLNVMACVYRENDADEICRVVRDNKLDLDKSVQNAAMQMYARCRRIDVARGFLIEFVIRIWYLGHP
ncbi:hypothetical protein FNV43_RR02896 [Rhamnella rubrinervis]|uniref:Pentatricopeptide repeat-containing protein n=1 Tax=Rhamnella rubrinervis TaxID=2594499 RepID=A0A8K0HI22_9ROSA|nr:hypothetical protein FNV43_RR02896 [Rhamnella rubrinervis]